MKLANKLQNEKEKFKKTDDITLLFYSLLQSLKK